MLALQEKGLIPLLPGQRVEEKKLPKMCGWVLKSRIPEYEESEHPSKEDLWSWTDKLGGVGEERPTCNECGSDKIHLVHIMGVFRGCAAELLCTDCGYWRYATQDEYRCCSNCKWHTGPPWFDCRVHKGGIACGEPVVWWRPQDANSPAQR